jgi:ABC-2 type transport system ATP-binding protein
MCSHIGIIEHGRLLASGDVATIMRSLRPHRVYEIHLLSDPAAAIETLQGLAGVMTVEMMPDTEPAQLQVDFDGDDHAVGELLGRLIHSGAIVTHFAGQVSDLEDVFMQVTQRFSSQQDA